MYKVKCKLNKKKYIIHFTTDIVQINRNKRNLNKENEEKVNTGVR